MFIENSIMNVIFNITEIHNISLHHFPCWHFHQNSIMSMKNVIMHGNCAAILVKCYIIGNRAAKQTVMCVCRSLAWVSERVYLSKYSLTMDCHALYVYVIYISSNPVLINGPHDTWTSNYDYLWLFLQLIELFIFDDLRAEAIVRTHIHNVNIYLYR